MICTEKEKEQKIAERMLRVVVGLVLEDIPHNEAIDIWTECLKEFTLKEN